MKVINKISIPSKPIKIERPYFITYKPNIKKIKASAKSYKRFKNIIIIGYGGSNTSFLAFYKTLYRGNKNVIILNTVEANEIKKAKRFKPKDTLVIAISKSGTTVGVIETLMAFTNYKGIVITSKESFLHKLSKRINFDFVEHPNVGGRFSARTPTTYLPLEILGIDSEKIEDQFIKAYRKYLKKNNQAMRLAYQLYELEMKGIYELYIPIYSKTLYNVSNLIIQLIHESSCKYLKGQTVFTAEAPEAQHHTNQRVFGGRRNLAIIFINVNDFEDDLNIKVPSRIKDLMFKSIKLNKLSKLSYNKALYYEFLGTYKDALNNKIPTSLIKLNSISIEEITELIAFFQLYAVYASVIRDVNPYDQPHVEASKRITFDLIKKH